MKIQRTKNAARNIVFDGLFRFVDMIVPFLMRTVMLHWLGVEYLGLNGLFRSILSFLNLAELGVGSAMVFSMYKPIAEDDTDKICALMRLYKLFYRAIGCFILVVGLALTPFLHVLVKGETPPDVNLYILYFMNLGSTVLTYWLFAYKNALLNAHQRNDIASKVNLGVHLVEYALKLASLIVFRSYYLYLTAQLLAQIAINLVTAMQVNRLFPQYSARGKLPKEQVLDIARRVRDLFTSKFSFVISNSADSLVITSFLGLATLAIYQNYYFILTSLRSFLDVLLKAVIAGVGNSLVVESMEKNYYDLRRFSLLFGWVMCVSSSMLLCLYQPFMLLWMGEENLLSFPFVVCFVVYYFFVGMNRVPTMFKDAAGIWHRDRFRPLTAALFNLCLNLLTVRYIGLFGVLLSTVVSIIVVELPWLFHNLFHEIFPTERLWEYVRDFILLALVSLVSCALSCFVCSLYELGPWVTLICNGAVSFLVPNAVFLLCYGRGPLFHDTLGHLKRVLLKKKG